jgi:small subunit ribosomal protein S20
MRVQVPLPALKTFEVKWKRRKHMAHHKSCIKRIRTSAAENGRNKAYRSEMRTEIKKLRSMTDPEGALVQLRSVTSLLDRLVCKNIIKANAAANRKSALTRLVNAL